MKIYARQFIVVCLLAFTASYTANAKPNLHREHKLLLGLTALPVNESSFEQIVVFMKPLIRLDPAKGANYYQIACTRILGVNYPFFTPEQEAAASVVAKLGLVSETLVQKSRLSSAKKKSVLLRISRQWQSHFPY